MEIAYFSSVGLCGQHHAAGRPVESPGRYSLMPELDREDSQDMRSCKGEDKPSDLLSG